MTASTQDPIPKLESDVEAAQDQSGVPAEQSGLRGLLSLLFKLFRGRGDPPREDILGMRDSVTRSLESSPKGYPMIANFQSSDRSFLQFRGFLDLHCRVLLDLQYDLECLEKELDALDQADAASISRIRQLCVLSNKEDREEAEWQRTRPGLDPAVIKRSRPVVLNDLKAKLTEYDAFMAKTREMSMLPRPSPRDYKSLIYWFESQKPLLMAEMLWIRRKEDIVTLRTGRVGAFFDELVERLLGVIDRFLTRWCGCTVINLIFSTHELREKTTDKYVRYYSPDRIDAFVNGLIAALVLTLLIIPVVVMWKLSSSNEDANPFEAIGILILFTLLFGGAMCSLTRATRQELFAASAAYCAVLVVFISNFTTQQVEIVSRQ